MKIKPILLLMAILVSFMVYAGPDLTVTDMEVSDLIPTAENVQTSLVVSISNVGDADAGLSHYTLEVTGETTRTIITPPLGAGQSYDALLDVVFSSVGAKNMTVTLDSASEVNEDNESNNVRTEAVTIVAATPSLNLGSGALTYSVDKGTTSKTGFFIVTNNGGVVLSNLAVSTTALSGGTENVGASSVVFSPSTFNLAMGASQTVDITMTLNANLKVDNYAGTITVNGTNVTATKAITLAVNEPTSTSTGNITIKKVKISITHDDDDDFTTLSYDEEETVAPGDKVQFRITLENEHDSLEIEDIDVTIELDGSDWDEDDDAEAGNLDEGDDNDNDPVEFSFTAPDDLDDGDEIEIKIEADGRDTDGNKHEVTFQATLKVKQKSDDLRITVFTADKLTVPCGGSTQATIRMENKGKSSQNKAYLTLMNSALGINQKFQGLELAKSGRSGDDITKKFNLNFAANKDLDGSYSIIAKLYDDDNDVMDTGVLVLKFDCEKSSTTTTNTDSTPSDSGDEVDDGSLVPVNATEVADSVEGSSKTVYIVLLSILLVAAIGAGVFVLVKVL